MNMNLAKFLKMVSEEIGNQNCRIVETYYGRGMGENCTNAVVVDSVVTLLVDVIQYVQGNIAQREWLGVDVEGFDIQDLRSDNLGNQTILY